MFETSLSRQLIAINCMQKKLLKVYAYVILFVIFTRIIILNITECLD